MMSPSGCTGFLVLCLPFRDIYVRISMRDAYKMHRNSGVTINVAMHIYIVTPAVIAASIHDELIELNWSDQTYQQSELRQPRTRNHLHM